MKNLVLLIIILCSQSLAAVAPRQFISQYQKSYSDSPQYKQIEKTLQSTRLSSENAEKEDPFTLTASHTETNFEKEQAPITGQRYSSQRSSKAGLAYKPRLGLGVELSYSLSSYQLQEPSVLSKTTNPYQVQLLVNYDLLKGSSSGYAMTAAKAKSLSTMSTYFSYKDEELNIRSQFQNLLIDVFINECKSRSMKKLKSLIEETVKSGQLQLKTKTLSQKDFLNFVDLDINFSKRILQIETTQNSYFDQIRAWGINTIDLKKNLAQQDLECDANAYPFDQVLQNIQKVLTSITPQQTFSVKSANSSYQASEKQLDAAKKTQLPSVLPFISYSRAKDEGYTKDIGSYAYGVQVEWNLPFTSIPSQIRETQISFEASRHAIVKATRTAEAKIADLKTRSETQIMTAKVLKQSLENSASLIKALTVQRSIGTIDSLNLTNSYLSQADATSALIDSMNAVLKIENEVAILNESTSAKASTQTVE